MKILEIFNLIIAQLAPIYGAREAQAIAYRLLEDKYGVFRNDLVISPNSEIEFDVFDIERLKNSEPIQYIIGFTEFLSRRFTVTPSVLIPRIETEELVLKIISDLGADFAGTITDIGTGSGCIAISLALAFPQAAVSAIDISQQAIDIATQNAAALGANVDFAVADLFDLKNFNCDIIVSNPPYVLYSEMDLMQANVIDFEPKNALFVPDNDPLKYYAAIVDLAENCARIYFEINEKFGDKMVKLLQNKNFNQVEIIKDIHLKDRICSAKR